MRVSTITLRRTVPGAPEQVYAAWTDPGRLERWWWPQLSAGSGVTTASRSPARTGWNDVVDRLVAQAQAISSRS